MTMDPKGAPPLRPPWPLAKRLNRNALTVAAALAGITVLTVVVVTSPSRPATDNAGSGTATAVAAAAPVPARPAFLDKPPSDASINRASEDALRSYRLGAGAPSGTDRVALPAAGPSFGVGPGGGREGEGEGEGNKGRQPESRAQAYQAALTSTVLVGAAGRATVAPREDGAVPVAAGGSGGVDQSDTSLSAQVARVRGPRELARGQEGAPGAPPAATLDTVGPSPATTAIRLEPAGSAFVVRAGTLIPGLLLTGVNSDLPGEALGQVSRDVFDSRTQRILLLPKGSRLIGAYDGRSAATGRLIVSWTRLLLPDGRSVTLPRLAGVDEQGQAGVHDQVDHHYVQIYGAALLTSALTAGVQLSQPQQTAVYAPPSSRQVAAGALGQSVGDVAVTSAQRGLDRPPTVVVRPGQPFNAILAGDLAFDGPYRPAGTEEAGGS